MFIDETRNQTAAITTTTIIKEIAIEDELFGDL